MTICPNCNDGIMQQNDDDELVCTCCHFSYGMTTLQEAVALIVEESDARFDRWDEGRITTEEALVQQRQMIEKLRLLLPLQNSVNAV